MQPVREWLSHIDSDPAHIFNTGVTTLTYEWEVNKAKNQIHPLNDATHGVMDSKIKRPEAGNR